MPRLSTCVYFLLSSHVKVNVKCITNALESRINECNAGGEPEENEVQGPRSPLWRKVNTDDSAEVEM